MAHATPARTQAAPAASPAPAARAATITTASTTSLDPELSDPSGPQRLTAASWREAGLNRYHAERLAIVDEATAAVGSLVALLEAEHDECCTSRATGRRSQQQLSDYDRANLFVAARLLVGTVMDAMDSTREQMVRDRAEDAAR